ncbi:MAG: hypothetical protein IJW64_03365 [Clostridia bacterium]|nr:hypothetical protein [Clostridia bacterium]
MKKLLSLLLVAVLSVCLLSCGNKAESIKAFSFGKEETSSESEISSWTTSYLEELADWNEEYSLRPQKWYKINYESARYIERFNDSSYLEDADESSEMEFVENVKCSGWYFASPYDFEKKYSLSLTYTVKVTSIDEDGNKKVVKYKVKAEEVYIDGVTYTKTTGKSTEGKNKTKTTEYSHDDYVTDFISETKFLGTNIFSLLDYGTIEHRLYNEEGEPKATYVKDRKMARFSSDRSAFDNTDYTYQYIVQLENKSPFIKGLKLYKKTAHLADASASIVYDANGEDGEEKPVYDSISVVKISVEPSFFGSVSRPSDYYKYF